MVITGLENVLSNATHYAKRKAALLCNHTSVTKRFEYSWNALKSAGIDVVRIFTPEHGLFAVEQDHKAVHQKRCGNIEIVSLYGDDQLTLRPSLQSLKGIDVVMYDIQDVGTRYYTYLNTMAYFLDSLNNSDVEFVVLDRPNPINGVHTEGPLLQKEFTSFVGVFDVTVRHGLTSGELALMYHAQKRIQCKLTVIPLKKWKRNFYFDDTGIPWIAPSPNMPSLNTALVYPGSCLLEGTNVSEGRGTTLPFQTIGAPFVNKEEFAKTLNLLRLPGVHFRPIEFRPTFHKYAGIVCNGVFIHVTDRNAFRPFLTGVAIVKTLHDLYGEKFKFLHTEYEFNTKHPAFDLLCGTNVIREAILRHAHLDDIFHFWCDDEKKWAIKRKEWFLY